LVTRCALIVLFLLVDPVVSRPDSLPDQIRAAQQSGNYTEAGKLYLQLIAAGTDTPEVRSNCGIMLHLAGQNRKALQQFGIALRQNPNLPAANLFAGVSEFELGAFSLALPYLRKAEQLDPGQPAPQLAIGKLYVATGQFRLANAAYAKAVAMAPQIAEAWYGLGVTNRSLAEEILKKANRQSVAANVSTQTEVQALLDKAVQALTRAAELEPDSARTHLLMAESLSDGGKLADAIPEYRAAIKLDPSLDAAYLGLATQYWKNRQFDEAVPLLKRTLAKSPEDPEANGMLADILEHEGNLKDAATYAHRALNRKPDLIQTRTVLARIYLAQQQPQLAITELQKVIAADPDGSYHFLLYRAYRAAGNEQAAGEAMAEFQRLRSRASSK
jgi:tetratricopeptide (TPR) repeat protein